MKKSVLITAAVFVLASLLGPMTMTADAAKAKKTVSKTKKARTVKKKKAAPRKKVAPRKRVAPRKKAVKAKKPVKKPQPKVKKVLKEIGPAPGTVRSATPIAKGLQVEGVSGEWLFNGVDWVRMTKNEVTEISPRGEVAKAGTKWAVVYVEVKNAGKKVAILGGDLHSMIVQDDKGNVYSDNIARRIPDWDNQQARTEILPDASIEMAYVFSLPAGNKPVKATFDPVPSGLKPPFSVKLQ